MIQAYAAREPKGKLEPFEYQSGPLHEEEVDIKVEYCGICHSDLSMLDNEWGLTQYPFVPGHEVVGTIQDKGTGVTNLSIGQRVGLGWFSSSCMTCKWCLSGRQNLCPGGRGTIVGRHGGFADSVRAHRAWVVPLPDSLDPAKAGPLFCGGITVFNPIVQCNVKPTDRVAVIGIGGLGHLAIQFLNAWGCEVTAFSSNPDKNEELTHLGAHHIVNSRDLSAIKSLAGSLDFILSTVNVPLDWSAYIEALAPDGHFHLVGAVLQPIPLEAFSLIMSQRSISGSPLGSPATVAQMLDFVARHNIETITEFYPFEKVNEALDYLRTGKQRYRLVLHH
ncbi:MAG: NAD(P)-dependent alcohol dehydrogenase [Chlorogloea purpurea SAG 13.99]|nr:NAD(P)-dependent alcohol dehydrogenase [Chlorogloea purpurea SAG 13.99]